MKTKMNSNNLFTFQKKENDQHFGLISALFVGLAFSQQRPFRIIMEGNSAISSLMKMCFARRINTFKSRLRVG